MKKSHAFIQLVCILLALLVPGVLCARTLDTNDLKKIQCAQDKMRILAGFFNVDSKETRYTLTDLCGSLASKPVTMPDWFQEELARMDKHKVVFVKTENQTYSEVDLWRQAFSNVYLYLDRAAQSLDPNRPVVLEQLSRGDVGNRLNLMATLDRFAVYVEVETKVLDVWKRVFCYPFSNGGRTVKTLGNVPRMTFFLELSLKIAGCEIYADGYFVVIVICLGLGNVLARFAEMDDNLRLVIYAAHVVRP